MSSEVPNQTKESDKNRYTYPRLLGLVVLIIALFAAWITFNYSYCGTLRCSYSQNVQLIQNVQRVQPKLQVSTQTQALTQAQPLTQVHLSNSVLTHLQIGNTTISIEYATTTAEEELGLSGRTSLAPLVGMWFVVNPPALQGMWMKDMNFPLDMIWFDQNMKVIYIAKDVTPQSYPEIFASNQAASYVLEVNADFVDLHNVALGQVASLTQ
jgi:uncharacterized membrane protein (UPF0127 family)